jgi:hypothetical protein
MNSGQRVALLAGLLLLAALCVCPPWVVTFPRSPRLTVFQGHRPIVPHPDDSQLTLPKATNESRASLARLEWRVAWDRLSAEILALLSATAAVMLVLAKDSKHDRRSEESPIPAPTTGSPSSIPEGLTEPPSKVEQVGRAERSRTTKESTGLEDASPGTARSARRRATSTWVVGAGIWIAGGVTASALIPQHVTWDSFWDDIARLGFRAIDRSRATTREGMEWALRFRNALTLSLMGCGFFAAVGVARLLVGCLPLRRDRRQAAR